MNKPKIFLTKSPIAQEEIGMIHGVKIPLEGLTETYLEKLTKKYNAKIGPILCVYKGSKGSLCSIAEGYRKPIDIHDDSKRMPFNAETVQKYFMQATNQQDKLIVTDMQLEEEVLRTLGHCCTIQRI